MVFYSAGHQNDYAQLKSGPGGSKQAALQPWFAALIFILFLETGSQAINIGVHNDEQILSFLSSLNGSEVARRFNATPGGTGGKFINASRFAVGPDPETLEQMRSYIETVRKNPPDLIIGSFNGTIAAIASELGIPCYCTSPSHQNRVLEDFSYLRGSSLLLMNSYTEDMVAASQKLTNTVLQRRALIVIADTVSDSLNYLLNSLSNQELHVVLLRNSSNASFIHESLYNTSQRANITAAVFQTLFSSAPMLGNVLPEAAALSLMKNTTYWIVTDLFPDVAQLMAYRRTGCAVFSFALSTANVTSAAKLSLAMAEDAVGHFLKATAGGAAFNFSAASTTSYSGVLGQLQFNVVTRRNQLSRLKIMMTSHKLPYIDEFGIWAKSNADGITLLHGGLTNKLPSLKVLAFMQEPFMMSSATEYYGFSVSVLSDISNGLFDLDIVPVSEFSSLLPLLRQGVGDIIANPIQLPLDSSKNDSNVSYSSWPLMYTSVTALGFAETPALDFLSPLYPFSWNVWLAVIVAFVVLSATLYSTDKISPNDYRRPKFSIAESVFFVYSSFMMSKLRATAVKPSSRIFILILWFASLMYCTTYGTNAFFMLIRSNRGLPFTSLTTLYNQSSQFYRVMVENSTSLQVLAAQPEGSVYKSLVPTSLLVESADAAVSLVNNQTRLPDGRRPIYVGDGATINYIVAKSCDLTTTGSDELHRPLHLAMRTGLNARLRRLISDRIQVMSDHGLLDQYQDMYWSAVKCSSNDNLINVKELSSIRIEQVSGIFIVLACALVLSFFVLLLEYAVHQLQLYWHRNKVNARLEFMTPYRAEVTCVSPLGIYIRVQGWQEFLPNQMLSPDPNKKISAADLQIRNGDTVEVVYFGNDPKTGERLFKRSG